jgi:hypothetical protein
MALLKSRKSLWMILFCGALSALPVRALQDPPEESSSATGDRPAPGWDYHFSLEARANYRDSDDEVFKTSAKQNGIPITEETVDPGSHYEVSDVTVSGSAAWGDLFTSFLKVDLIDLYDRNPTSTGQTVDIDEAWVRFGREPETATLAPGSGVYVKLGKIAKFERQNDRHLQSYGLVSTAFNRFEETGGEVGVHLGRHLYFKFRGAAGNPVFLRDTNALAGDNGTPALLHQPPDPRLNSGAPILYNAHYANFNLDGKLETGVGVGWRIADEGGRNGLDVLAWGNKRKLADRVSIHGTFYGGDLDILNGPEEPDLNPADVTYAITNDEKREAGGNVWLYLGGFSFFGQYVNQDLAGLPRTGLEGEVAWRFDLPLVWALHGRQVFTSIAPAVRYSKLDNGFNNPKTTPSPSFAWDWRKIDSGLRFGLYEGLDLTVEYADHKIFLPHGIQRRENETLVTLGLKL